MEKQPTLQRSGLGNAKQRRIRKESWHGRCCRWFLRFESGVVDCRDMENNRGHQTDAQTLPTSEFQTSGAVYRVAENTCMDQRDLIASWAPNIFCGAMHWLTFYWWVLQTASYWWKKLHAVNKLFDAKAVHRQDGHFEQFSIYFWFSEWTYPVKICKVSWDWCIDGVWSAQWGYWWSWGGERGGMRVDDKLARHEINNRENWQKLL